MGKRPRRIPTEGDSGLSNNPFGSLDAAGLPDAPNKSFDSVSIPVEPKKKKSRGRVDVRREKSGRGGKTVTVISGFLGIALEEKTTLAKALQKRCGTGGAVKNGNIEIQGDKREEAQVALEEAGFRVVFTGG